MAGFDNDVCFGTNLDFSGGSPVSGKFLLDGQILIGRTALNAGGTHIDVNTLTAGTGISITNGPGTITITNTGGGGGGGGANSLAGDTGSAPNIGGVINVMGGTNITTTGDGVQTLTISPTGNLLGLAGLSGTGYIVQTGAGTFVNRTFVAGSGISLTNASGVAGATTITAGATVPTTFTEDAGTATPALNNINILGTSAQGISTSGAGSTVTLTNADATSSQKGVAKFDVTNFTVAAGNVTSNALTVTAGTGLATGGSVNLGGSVTIALDIPVSVPHGGTGDITLTNHGVMLGQGTSAVVVTAAGTNGQVLVGGTGIDPAFATVGGTQGVTITGGSNTLSIGLSAVPNSALANSSITVSAGAGISVSGSPVSLGGTVTISATGTIVTQFSSDAGVATPSGNNINLLGTAAQGLSTSASGATVTFTNATATTSQKGVVNLATNAQAIAGTDANNSVTAAALAAKLGTQTAHGVAIFEGTTSALAVAATSATSGVPLVSQGAAADPAFGTAVVAGGGTGDTSFTAYSVITGGTTSTGALQNVSGVGTSGQVLTSNGAGTLPTWQTPTAVPIAANTTVSLIDDFIGVSGGTAAGQTINSSLSWRPPQSNSSIITQAQTALDSGHPGLIKFGGLTSVNNVYGLMLCSLNANSLGSSNASIILGGGAITLNWVMRIATLSDGTNTYTISLGFSDIISSSAFTNGIFFSYTNGTNSGKWVGNTINNSVSSTANSNITAETTSFHNFQININALATSVSFLIDGVEISNSPLTTNIPTIAISPFIKLQRSAGTLVDPTMYIDLFYMTQNLTVAR